MDWKSQSWPFHVCLKVVQCIMEPMILYYLPLLPWTKKALHSILYLLFGGQRGRRYCIIARLSLLDGYHLRLKKNGEYTNPIMDGGTSYNIVGILNCHL